MMDTKSRELNLYPADSSKKFRVLPFNDAETGACFELKTTDDKNAGNSGVYVEYLMTNTNYGKLGVGLTLGQLKDRATALESSYAIELAARTSADVKLQSAVDSEAATRLAADSAHTASIAQEISDRTQNDYYNTVAINTEKSRAQNAEYVLTTGTAQLILDVAAEASRASEEETKLNARVLLEIQTRGDSVYNEAVLRTAADDVLNAKCVVLTADVSAEVAERKSEVKRIDGRLDFIVSNTSPEAIDSLSEIITQFSQNGVGYATRLQWLEAVVADLVSKSQ